MFYMHNSIQYIGIIVCILNIYSLMVKMEINPNLVKSSSIMVMGGRLA